VLLGVKIKDVIKFPDERGSFAEILRDDWSDFIEPEESFENQDNTKILFKDDPVEKNLVVWYDLLDPKPQLNTEELLSKIPNFLKSDAERIFRDSDITGLPDWFKETAQW